MNRFPCIKGLIHFPGNIAHVICTVEVYAIILLKPIICFITEERYPMGIVLWDLKGPHKENTRFLNQLFPCHICTMDQTGFFMHDIYIHTFSFQVKLSFAIIFLPCDFISLWGPLNRLCKDPSLPVADDPDNIWLVVDICRTVLPQGIAFPPRL